MGTSFPFQINHSKCQTLQGAFYQIRAQFDCYCLQVVIKTYCLRGKTDWSKEVDARNSRQDGELPTRFKAQSSLSCAGRLMKPGAFTVHAKCSLTSLAINKIVTHLCRPATTRKKSALAKTFSITISSSKIWRVQRLSKKNRFFIYSVYLLNKSVQVNPYEC